MARPNILICGTPGTGKTTLCTELASRTGMEHVGISDLVKERGLYHEFDEDMQSYVIDEDRVVDEMEDPQGLNVPGGGKIIEYHGCDFFPERYFQLVVVLRTENSVLWERLESRGYAPRKIQENVEAEIMQVLLEEAKESYPPDIVWELPSNSLEDIDTNLDTIIAWLKTSYPEEFAAL